MGLVNLEKQKPSRRHNSPRLQAILQSYSNQDSVVLVLKRHTNQRNRLEKTEINSDTYGELIFDKGDKNIKWEKVSSAIDAGKTRQPRGNQ